ncbi:cysteinyl leukotriene receptor 2 [Misgurnus anguillicaudatus]|uniref:cysteinyl leukotriene receptor 2 n=1 Tax=Misgurnus anguillicaudatus TaxID=75329 RepID=UPI003CCFC6DF
MNYSSTNTTSCEDGTDGFKQIMYPVTYIIIFALGSAGHSLSICVFFKQWKKQRSLTPVNLLMVNLLFSDLMLVCSLPLRVAYYLQHSYWPFGDIPCRLSFYVFYLNMYSSVYFLVALNILRYIALVWPYLYMRMQTSCGVVIICASIWVLMALACSPLLFSSTDKEKVGSTRCLELSLVNVDKMLFINNISLVMGFVVPLVIIIFCSVFVVKSLLTPSPALGKTRPSRRKACALVIISLGIFLVCFLPYHVVRTVFLSAEKQLKMNGNSSCNSIWVVRKAAVITHCLCTTNSCLDPLLFFFVGENFRSFSAKFLARRRTSKMRSTLRQEELQVLKK